MGALIFIIILALVALFYYSYSKEKERVSLAKSKLDENIKKIANFKPTKRIEANNLSYSLLFDDIQKKMVVARNHYLGIINYNEIINVEIRVDNTIISSRSTSKTVGRAVAGGLLLGGVGAILGGVTAGNKNRKYVSNVFIKIETINPNKSVFDIEIFNAIAMCGTNEIKPFTFKWDIYQNCLKKAREIESQIGGIIEKNSQNIDSCITSSNHSTDEILKFHQLLKEGIITQEEFDKEKTKILNKS